MRSSVTPLVKVVPDRCCNGNEAYLLEGVADDGQQVFLDGEYGYAVQVGQYRMHDDGLFLAREGEAVLLLLFFLAEQAGRYCQHRAAQHDKYLAVCLA